MRGIFWKKKKKKKNEMTFFFFRIFSIYIVWDRFIENTFFNLAQIFVSFKLARNQTALQA